MTPCVFMSPCQRPRFGAVRPGRAGAGLIACLAVLSLGGGVNAQPREIWKGQPDRVTSLAVSPDGKTLASCTYNGREVTLWDLAAGKKTGALASDQPYVGNATFTPDGKSLLSFICTPLKPPEAGKEVPFQVTVQVWDLATQKVRLTFDYPENARGGLITPDGKSLIVASPKAELLLYDLATGKPSDPIELGKDCQSGQVMALSPDGKTLALGTKSSRGVLLWDMEKKAVRATVPVGSERSAARTLVFSPDGKTLATGVDSDEVALWGAATGNPKGKLKFDPRVVQIFAVAFSPDGKTVAVSGDRWGVALWDLAAGGARDDFDGELSAWVERAVFTPDGKTLITAGLDKDHAIKLWDVPQGKPAGVKPVGQLTPAETKQLHDVQKP